MNRTFLSLYATRRDTDSIGEQYEVDECIAAYERAEALEQDGWFVTLSRVYVSEHVSRVDYRRKLARHRDTEATR